MVTEEQIRFFDENGCLKYGKVLEPSEVEALIEALDRIVRVELEGGDDLSVEFSIGHRRKVKEARDEPRTLTQYVNVWKRDKDYEKMVRHPLITGIAKTLLKTPEVRLWHDHIISKPPGDNAHFRYHQDFYGWPLSEPSILSCWIALDDATVENGCMHVIPGSHRDPRFSPEAKRKELEALAKDPTLKTERVKMEERHASFGVPVELKTGECMFHHCLDFHATPQNTTNRQRRAFVIIYMAQGVRFYKAQAPEHCLVPIVEVNDGDPLVGSGFPVVT
jgi:ectoine hydroxylase-related dioxygenase (phytanoyl-CoA dioxygenase family)